MYGHAPSVPRRLVRLAARAVVRALGLTGASTWSNEITQALNPTATVDFDGVALRFRTGNGRLLWRVRTFLEEEPLMLRWIAGMGPEDVVLDIGANAGLYSVAMARRAGRVYACELDPLNVGLIHENALLNGVQDRVVVLPVACAATDGVVEVHFRDLSPGDALQSMGRPQPIPTRLGPRPHVSPVLTLSLDELWDRAQLPRPTKIKIDVDGNERVVFEGSGRLFAGAREIYFEDSELSESHQVLEELLAMGFDVVDRVGLDVGSNPGSVGATGYRHILRRRGS
jgi:FkbM family methyltransferase